MQMGGPSSPLVSWPPRIRRRWSRRFWAAANRLASSSLERRRVRSRSGSRGTGSFSCTLRAVSDSLQRLLQLQERDLVADQLRHRKATLPERAALTERKAAISALDAERADVAARLADTERVQKRLE